MIIKIGALVEGPGDVAALPLLLVRMQNHIQTHAAKRRASRNDIQPLKPVSLGSKSLFLNRTLNDYEREFTAMMYRVGPKGRILVMVDSDDDDSEHLRYQLMERTKQHQSDVQPLLVIPVRAFESWFVAAAESLGGQVGLRSPLTCPRHFEEVDPKSWYEQNHKTKRRYIPTVDQPKLTEIFDFEKTLKKSISFRTFYEEIERLILTT